MNRKSFIATAFAFVAGLFSPKAKAESPDSRADTLTYDDATGFYITSSGDKVYSLEIKRDTIKPEDKTFRVHIKAVSPNGNPVRFRTIGGVDLDGLQPHFCGEWKTVLRLSSKPRA